MNYVKIIYKAIDVEGNECYVEAACVLTIFHNQDREIAIFREKMDNHCHNAQYCYVSSSPGLSMFYGCRKK
jgi:hypothetical protein